MLSVSGLSKAYDGNTVLENVSFRVPTNDTLVIIGASGCGKSTLLKCIANIVKYEHGTITFNENDIKQMKNDLGYCLQDQNLLPWLTVRDNLSLGLVARKKSKAEIKSVIETLANELGIEHLLNQYPKTLSGGEKQRVAIGAILAFRPSLLLLDEPSGALDAMTKEKFQDWLKTLQKQYNVTTIVVTHSIEEAVYLGNQIMVMEKGGKYQNYDVEGNKSPKWRKDIQFFEQCKIVRRMLETGEQYEIYEAEGR
ncbi:MAG: ABC transporter ATP-binding protein [Cellulosilyticaceae bacterium]